MVNGAAKLLWGWDSTGKVWIPIEVDADGLLKVDLSAVNFLDLADTPSAYTGEAGKFPQVNAGENALEFIAHKDVATGVHGVGALYVAGIEAAGDEAAKKLDTFTFNAEWLGLPFDTLDGWTEAYIGSGSRVSWGINALVESTGTTLNSEAGVYTGSIGNLRLNQINNKFFCIVQNSNTALTNFEWLIGLWLFSAAKPPSLTAKHIGWKVINGDVYATNADGTTETATDTGIDIDAAWKRPELLIECTSTEAELKYYVDGVLKATHTTNIPTGNLNAYIYFSVKTTDTVDKRLKLVVARTRKP